MYCHNCGTSACVSKLVLEKPTRKISNECPKSNVSEKGFFK